GHVVRRIEAVLIGYVRGEDPYRARLVVREVRVGIKGEGSRTTARASGVRSARRARDREPTIRRCDGLGEPDRQVRIRGDTGCGGSWRGRADSRRRVGREG